MNHLIRAIALVAFVIQAEASAGELPGLRRALEAAPQSTLSLEALKSSHILLSYIDMSAVDRLQTDREDSMPMRSALKRLHASEIAPSESILYSAEWENLADSVIINEWKENANVAIADIEGFVGYGLPPARSVIWLIREPSKAAALPDRLVERGYILVGTGSADNPTLVDNRNDIDEWTRQIANPWRALGPGFPTAVGLRGADILQTTEPDQISSWRKELNESEMASRHPLVQIALHGLEATLGDETILTKALFLSPLIGHGTDTMDLFVESVTGPKPNLDMETFSEELQETIARRRATGLPPYILAVLADIETPGIDRGAVMAFAYPDCELAKIAGERFVQRWQTVTLRDWQGQTMAELAPGDIQTSAVENGGAGCAAMVTITNAPPEENDKLENPIFNLIRDSIYRGDFAVGVFAG